MFRRVVLSKLNDDLKKERKKEKKDRGILVISFIKIKKNTIILNGGSFGSWVYEKCS